MDCVKPGAPQLVIFASESQVAMRQCSRFMAVHHWNDGLENHGPRKFEQHTAEFNQQILDYYGLFGFDLKKTKFGIQPRKIGTSATEWGVKQQHQAILEMFPIAREFLFEIGVP